MWLPTLMRDKCEEEKTLPPVKTISPWIVRI